MSVESMGEQVKNHFIAILSLLIAVVALTYSTWREEVTERNRNTRLASFEVLKNLGELQIIVNYAHYQPDNSMGNPILGWGHIALIGDMGQLLPPPVPEKTQALVKAWGENWENLKDQETTEKISQDIDSSREAVLNVIKSLR